MTPLLPAAVAGNSSLVPLLVDVGTRLEEATGLLQYVLVVVFAAIPVIEILVVVPVGIGIGLDPLLTGVAAFVGNVGSVYLLIGFESRLRRWWRDRRGGESDERPDRYARARRLWDQYGLPGLSLASPVLTGVHIATLVALVAGSSSRSVAWWMTVGIAVWTVALVLASVYGLSVVGII
ncbi:small multi-drug export protein [Salinadaptatus halalkaliphilus]|uniref:Small multi-drug export protein n=1 Tax=Salinadaptatus halalkaliphilus TaxID=2419781 RepID=A0A4S3TII9_9EURY|nr:small multi-drug export protein [Salinadaptatus halalkaliphilus]THE63771.1 small multi-drug export protein [Salinadaptatus halalkaliphilus]